MTLKNPYKFNTLEDSQYLMYKAWTFFLSSTVEGRILNYLKK